MTKKEFDSLAVGDIVRVVDWERFTNKQMREFIGREFIVCKSPRENNGYAKLREDNGPQIYGSWQERDLELVTCNCEADITLLF